MIAAETYWRECDGLEELSAANALLQSAAAPGILVDEQVVCVQTTRLARQHLQKRKHTHEVFEKIINSSGKGSITYESKIL